MSWFRSNRGRITSLALFALACQLVLSFGHVHLGKVSVAPIVIAAIAPLTVTTSDDSPGLPRAPPQKSPHGFGDDFCAICASISLASLLVVPTAPAVVPPFSSDAALTWSHGGLDPIGFDHVFFDARGPPHA